ncbi:MAG: GIY-YIG nuclease family protein [candidate division WOR-3 bacterium]
MKFDKGYYVYLGSAHKNILQRIKRHLSNYKKKFWHIDYLLMGQGVKVKEVWVGSRKNECEMALCFIENRFQYAKKFGSSDCECPSHLFMVDENISKVKNTLRKNGFRKLNL